MIHRPLRRAILLAVVVAGLLLLAGLALSRLPLTAAMAPDCFTDCTSPFGSRLGATPRGVPAYSNCSADCLVLQTHRVDGEFMGLKWQCVEFARRWLAEQRGVVFNSVSTAAEIWDRVDSVRSLADGRHWPVQRFLNGAPVPPAVGDLLVYGRTYAGTGHVAVVTGLSPTQDWVEVGEQNYDNRPWAGDHARRLSLIHHDRDWWLLDAHLVGWKRPMLSTH